MIVNRLTGVVERYTVLNGVDTWEVVYDPTTHGISQLNYVVEEIKRIERLKFAHKLNALADEFK